MQPFDYWLPVTLWLDDVLKKGRRALYRATRMDAAGIWKRDDGTTIHQRVSAQLDERRHDLDAARCELQMARNRAKPRRTWIEAGLAGESLPFAITAGASVNGVGM